MSTPYTIQDDDRIRQRIDADLETVCRTVRDGDPRLEALVLTGGFARGEGMVIDGEPKNDYDFVAFRRGGACRPYAKMAAELAVATGLPIDLHPVWVHRLRWLSPSIFWYETAVRGRVLWGDKGVLQRIPIQEASRIAPGESMRLLCNRAAGLLLACAPDDDAKRLQACKALLGALDAHLLVHGIFPPTHIERWRVYLILQRTGQSPRSLERIHDALDWAIQYKTQPTQAPPMDADVAWREAASAILAAVPAALDHCGVPDLDAYARQDSWPERLHYWLRGRWPQKGPWMLHPSCRVRVATLQALQAKLLPARKRPEDLPEDVGWLRGMRSATLQ